MTLHFPDDVATNLLTINATRWLDQPVPTSNSS